MNKAWATKNGFTIIELIITIVVIGILITVMTISYVGIQQRSRDTRRDNDVTQIKVALEKYHAEKSQYPAVCSSDNTECSVTALSTALQPYLPQLPHDPRNAADSATDYRYIRGASSTDSYGILVNYEAKAVCKTGQNITVTWWGATYPSC